jgi:2,3-diketo-5-methylthio-1-phosphopentane phosphatase
MYPTVFLDFDGTISRADVVDAILERHADRAWLQVEEAWRGGRIGSRECLRQQIGLVRATPAELDALIEGIGFDDGFADVLRACDAAGAPAHVISDGFDYCIERILRRVPAEVRRLVASMRIFSSHLEPSEGGRWRSAFPFPEEGCIHGCATCKPSVMAALNPGAGPSIFVGDGLSDRHAAKAATMVFAKDKLAAWCAAERISFVPYATLHDVAAHLDEQFRSGALARRSSAARA